MSKQPPPAPTASVIGPTIIDIVGRPGTRSLPMQDHRTTRPPPSGKNGTRKFTSSCQYVETTINFEISRLALSSLYTIHVY